MIWTMASKLLPYLVYPFSLGIWLLLLGVVLLLFRWRRSGTMLVVLAALLLSVFSMPRVGFLALDSLERQYPPVPVNEIEQGDLIVTLGGALGLPLAPRLEPDMHGSTDRVWHAARLYRAGKAPRIFIAGGNVFPGYHDQGEAYYIAQLLQEWGVPASAIAFEAESRSTAENARMTMSYLQKEDLEQAKVLLVTSAAHMPRALATFRTAGIDAVPAATDYLVTAPGQPSIFSWLPSAGVFNAVNFTVREYLGMLVYRMRGWIE